MFYIRANNSTINVRTRMGRKYCFNFSDIDKVTCSTQLSSKRGAEIYLTINVKEHKLEMVHTMDGFKQMAGYILERYESGEINKEALTKMCITKLYQYKDGDFNL